MSAASASLGTTGFLYRFDIYLPLKDRSGNRVPFAKLNKLRKEIVRRFGGITHTTIIGNPIFAGYWKSPETKKMVQDDNAIYTVLTPRTDESYLFFVQSKARWRIDLDYEELLITVHPIEALPD